VDEKECSQACWFWQEPPRGSTGFGFDIDAAAMRRGGERSAIASAPAGTRR